MGILARFFGSDLDLKGPDFDVAPKVEIDFSGSKISFFDPPQTARFPVSDWPEDMNIFDKDNFEKQRYSDFAKRFYVKGWNLKGAGNKALASVTAVSILSYFDQEYYDFLGEQFNCFVKKDFEAEIFRYCHTIWGRQNKAKSLGDIGSGRYSYPIDSSNLKYVKFNETEWCSFSSAVKGKPPKFIYATPVSEQHIIFNSFSVEAFRGLDYYSPKTNLEQASNAVIKDFMLRFVLDLSNDMKSLKKAAESV